MKARLGLLVWFMLMGMAFAANGSGYYNLVSITTGGGFGVAGTITKILSQSDKSCNVSGWSLTYNAVTYSSDGKGSIGSYTYTWNPWAPGASTFTKAGTCLASVRDTPANLRSILKTHWTDGQPNPSGETMVLGSDLDLGEFSAATASGTCTVNHEPIAVLPHSTFNGNGFSIRNLCYASKTMTAPVGFFESVSYSNFQNVKIGEARIVIDGASGNGADYYPVGALAGTVAMATIENVTLSDIDIQAPFAGALVGYVENSSLKNIRGDDDIVVSNKVAISNGYAGSKIMHSVSDYQVFLGGVAGVAYRSENEDGTFESDSLKVEVHDLVKTRVHKSALGGIAGLFSTTGESVQNLNVYSKYKTEEVVPTKISGGSAMGGLFGVMSVYMENSSPMPGNFTLENSHFDGLIYDGVSSGTIAVGGLIGQDSVVARMSVVVKNSSAKVDVKDSLKETGAFHYYAGGILGYGSSCIGGTGETSDYFSFIDVNTSGKIQVAASGKAVPGLHSQTYLGGIAGSACLAQKEGYGLHKVRSSVDLIAKTKTALDDKRVVNGFPAYDSLLVGGLMGSAYVSVAQANLLENLYFTGTISIEDSLNNVFAGGVLGAFVQTAGGKSLRFKNVFIENPDFITYKAVAAANSSSQNKQTAKIGGVCGSCNEVGSVESVGIRGNVKVSGAYAGDSLFVGGLLGSIYSSTTILNVKNTYTNGNILVSATAGDGKVVKSGYLLGDAQLYGADGKSFEIMSNYHFGDSDLLVGPFGMLKTSSDETTSWKTSDNIHYVIRNGTEKRYTGVHHNGTELPAAMKKSSFAGFMNGAYSDAADYVWTFVSEKNDNLPFLIDGKNPAIEPGVSTFVVAFVDKDGVTIKSENIANGGAATAPTLEEMPEFEGYTFTGNWDKSFAVVVEDMTITAEYKINSYVVKFLDFDGLEIAAAQEVEYGAAAVVPENPQRKGYEFIGWDDSSFVKVKNDLDIKALYLAKKYQISFEDFDGTLVAMDSVEFDSPVAEPVALTRKATAEYTYTFKGWDPAVIPVAGNAVYTAVYDSSKVKYKVTFVDADGTQIGEAQMVEYGSAAVAPEAPELAGYVFIGWDRKFESIVGDLEIKARYDLMPALESSSSRFEVSSSSFESSSSMSSSSSAPELKIVAPVIEQSGNAIRLTFDSENGDANTTARVVVSGENGMILDTLISESVVKGGVWEMTPAPMGKFTVELVLDNGESQCVYADSFEVASEIVMLPRSWKMVSLSALDKANFGKNDDTSFYWWDEQNPVGDYWQYRSFEGGHAEATRGFWYGSTDGTPLVLREVSGSMASEIIWNLDSLYSGWNLVANPFGWYVDLTAGKAEDGRSVTFWRWNAETSEYEIPTVIGPYEAVWAKVNRKVVWRVSAAPCYGVREMPGMMRNEALLKSTDAFAQGFTLVASLVDEYGKKDSWNVMVAGSGESLEEPPAGMGDRVNLSIVENGTGFAKSIKAVADSYRWTLKASASTPRSGKLSFDGVRALEKQGYKLQVDLAGKTYDLADGEDLPLALSKTAAKMEVRVVNAAAVVTKLKGLNAIVNQGSIQLGFSAPAGLEGAVSKYAIVDVKGKKIFSGQFVAQMGTNSILVSAPQPGVYFVKLTVGSQKLTQKILVK